MYGVCVCVCVCVCRSLFLFLSLSLSLSARARAWLVFRVSGLQGCRIIGFRGVLAWSLGLQTKTISKN